MKTEAWKNIGRVVGLFAALAVMERYGILNDLNAYIKRLNPAAPAPSTKAVAGVAPADDDLDAAIFRPPSTKVVAQQEYYDLATPIDEMLTEESNTENAKLPRMVDKETRLDTTFSHGPRFTYMYTMVGFSSAELKPTKFMAVLQANSTAQVCGSTAFEPYLQRGATFNHVLRGSDLREIGRFSIALADCYAPVGSDAAKITELERNQEERFMEDHHGDWQGIIQSDDYQVWLATQPEETRERATTTPHAKVLSNVLDSYKAAKTAAGNRAQRNRAGQVGRADP